MNLPTRLAAATVAAGAAGLGYAYAESRWFVLRQASVPVLPPGSRPLRVLHITDLHLTHRQRRKHDWLRRLAVLDPDLVVSTGDNLASMQAVPHVLSAYGG